MMYINVTAYLMVGIETPGDFVRVKAMLQLGDYRSCQGEVSR